MLDKFTIHATSDDAGSGKARSDQHQSASRRPDLDRPGFSRVFRRYDPREQALRGPSDRGQWNDENIAERLE